MILRIKTLATGTFFAAVLTLAAPALYLDPNHDRVLWPALVFLPFAALLVFELLRHARSEPLLATHGGPDVPNDP